MEKISIIIPVYNVEPYLERCLNSVINQTYSNIEIILVDDGSTDKSGRICDYYSEIDNRVLVIHKRNGGLSEARNTGLDKSSGKLISFIDSDDFVDIKFVERMYDLISKYGADIAICGYEKGRKDKFTSHKYEHKITTFNSKEMLKQWHGKYKHYETVAWNKLYKKYLFQKEKKIKFPVGYNNEDVQTTHLLVDMSDKIVITNEKLYYYYQRPNSIINTLTEKSINDSVYAQKVRLNFFSLNKYTKAYDRMYIKLMKYYMLTYCKLNDNGMKKKEKEILKAYIEAYENLGKIHLHTKMFFYFFIKFNRLVKIAFKAYIRLNNYL